MTVRMIALDGSWTSLTDDVLEALRGQLRGQVVVPASPSGVPNTRDVFNAMHVGRPAVIVQCSDTDDVVHTVNFARRHNLAAAVRGGGHSVAGLSTIVDGMLIDLSAMCDVKVDPTQQLAHVQGGAVLSDVDRATQIFGLATPLEGLDGTAVNLESSVGFRVVLDGVPWTVLAPQRKTTAHLTSTYALRVTVTMHRRSEWRRSAS